MRSGAIVFLLALFCTLTTTLFAMKIRTDLWCLVFSLVLIGSFAGCSSSEATISGDSDEVEQFLKDNPDVANADMEPPADPE